MKININECALENFSHIYFSVSGKLPPRKFPSGKFPPIKLSPGEFPPGKLPPRKFPPIFLNIPTRVFWFFFSLLSPLSLMLLERLFCNSMFYECWSLYVSENLSKRSVKWRRQLMKWVGIFQVRIFLGGNFPGAKGFSRGEFYGLEFFEWDFPRGGFP